MYWTSVRPIIAIVLNMAFNINLVIKSFTHIKQIDLKIILKVVKCLLRPCLLLNTKKKDCTSNSFRVLGLRGVM